MNSSVINNENINVIHRSKIIKLEVKSYVTKPAVR